MKKKVLSVLLALAMVVGLFGGMQKDAQASADLYLFVEENLNCTVGGGMPVSTYLELAFDPDWIPGKTLAPGKPIDDGFECFFYLMDQAYPIDLPTNICAYDYSTYIEFFNGIFMEIMGNSDRLYQNYERLDRNYTDKVPAVPAGYDAWKIQALAEVEGMIYLLYPVKLTPPAPEVRDCELATAGGTTTWKDYYGKTVWTITEKEDAITADLNDWAAIPDAIVKAWKESGKAISLSYKWKGYSVSIAIPEGEIARTGEAWYGGEYIAKVNEQYVTVKDWFGQTVSADVLYTK